MRRPKPHEIEFALILAVVIVGYLVALKTWLSG
jgi:Flp pilus assembly pilin Flp